MIVKIDPDAVGDAGMRLAIHASAIEHVTSQLRGGAPSALPERDFLHVTSELDALSRGGHELAARAYAVSKEVGELARHLSLMSDNDSALSAALSVIFGESAPSSEEVAGVWEYEHVDDETASAPPRGDEFDRAIQLGLESARASFADNPVNTDLPGCKPHFPPSSISAASSNEVVELNLNENAGEAPSSAGAAAALSLALRADEMIQICRFEAATDQTELVSFVSDGDELIALDTANCSRRATAPRPVKSLLWEIADAIGVIERPGQYERVPIPAGEVLAVSRSGQHSFLGGDRIVIRRSALTSPPDDPTATPFGDELVFVGERGSMRAAFRAGDEVVFARVEESLLVGLLGLALGPRNHPPSMPVASLTPATSDSILDAVDRPDLEPISINLLNNVGLASASWLVAEDLAPSWLRALLCPEVVLTLQPGAESGTETTVRFSIAAESVARWQQVPDGTSVSVHESRGLHRLTEDWTTDAAMAGGSISMLHKNARGFVEGQEFEIGSTTDPLDLSVLFASILDAGKSPADEA